MTSFEWWLHRPGPFARVPTRSYLVVAAPRTGTTRLCDLLRSDRCLGRPEEYFAREHVPIFARRWRIDDPLSAGGDGGRYLERMLLVGSTWNRVFGAKLLSHQVDDTFDLLGIDRTGAAPELELYDRFPQLSLVHLWRADKVRVAVSTWRAQTSGQWQRGPWQAIQPVTGELDIDVVSRAHADAHAFDDHWQAVLAGGARGISLRFEDLIADEDAAVQAVADTVGVRPGPRFHRLTGRFLPQSLSDEASDRLVQAWVDRTGGCEECGHPSA